MLSKHAVCAIFVHLEFLLGDWMEPGVGDACCVKTIRIVSHSFVSAVITCTSERFIKTW